MSAVGSAAMKRRPAFQSVRPPPHRRSLGGWRRRNRPMARHSQPHVDRVLPLRCHGLVAAAARGRRGLHPPVAPRRTAVPYAMKAPAQVQERVPALDATVTPAAVAAACEGAQRAGREGELAAPVRGRAGLHAHAAAPHWPGTQKVGAMTCPVAGTRACMATSVGCAELPSVVAPAALAACVDLRGRRSTAARRRPRGALVAGGSAWLQPRGLCVGRLWQAR